VAGVIDRHEPDVLVLEQLFFNTNVKSAMAVGESRGAIMLAAEHAGVTVAEYTPLEIKMALVGYGRAEKQQVNYMVRSLLNVAEISSDHASDALAAAVCHAHHLNLEERIQEAQRPPTRGGAR
jgi:crossover junction endodeoxyribonuclease RuvC